jgi:guanylate kinase
MKDKKLIIFSAPSGAGKTSIVRELIKQIPDLAFSVTATTRQKRNYEEEGKDYYFITAEEFREKIKNDEFVEWEEVYDNQFYGTLKTEVERLLNEGKHVIFDVDVKGGMNIKKQYGDRALSIFVKPPSIKTLRTRLINRQTEDEASLAKRLNKAESEMKYARYFDVVVLNDKLEEAIKNARKYIEKHFEK